MKIKVELTESIWENEDDRKNLEELGFRFEQRKVNENHQLWFVCGSVEIEIESFEKLFKFMDEWGPLEFYNYDWEDDEDGDDWGAWLRYIDRPYLHLREGADKMNEGDYTCPDCGEVLWDNCHPEPDYFFGYYCASCAMWYTRRCIEDGDD